MVHRVVDTRLQALQRLTALLLPQGKDPPLGTVEQFIRGLPAVVAQTGDFRRHADEISLLGRLANNPRVVDGVCRGGLVVGDLRQYDHASHCIEQVFDLQMVIESR